MLGNLYQDSLRERERLQIPRGNVSVQQEEVLPLQVVMVSSPLPPQPLPPRLTSLAVGAAPSPADWKLRVEAHSSCSLLTPAPEAVPASASLSYKYWLNARLSH